MTLIAKNPPLKTPWANKQEWDHLETFIGKMTIQEYEQLYNKNFYTGKPMNITNETWAKEKDVTEVIQSIPTCEDTCMISKRKDAGLPELDDEPIYGKIQDYTTIEDIEEKHRLQMTAISTAASGYWKQEDEIHPNYWTPSLIDVAKLYKKYDELYKMKNTIWYKLYKFFN
jgi:hypothetical protein